MSAVHALAATVDALLTPHTSHTPLIVCAAVLALIFSVLVWRVRSSPAGRVAAGAAPLLDIQAALRDAIAEQTRILDDIVKVVRQLGLVGEQHFAADSATGSVWGTLLYHLQKTMPANDASGGKIDDDNDGGGGIADDEPDADALDLLFAAVTLAALFAAERRAFFAGECDNRAATRRTLAAFAYFLPAACVAYGAEHGVSLRAPRGGAALRRAERHALAPRHHFQARILRAFKQRRSKSRQSPLASRKECAEMARALQLPSASSVLAARLRSDINEPAFVIYRDERLGNDGNVYVVAVRGTAELLDWLTNLAVVRAPSDDSTVASAAAAAATAEPPLDASKVHVGMHEAAEYVLRELAEVVRDEHGGSVGGGESVRVVFVGHSLGAGVAALAAQRLHEAIVDDARGVGGGVEDCGVRAYCYAPPRTAHASKAHAAPYVRALSLHADCVPRVDVHSAAALQRALVHVARASPREFAFRLRALGDFVVAPPLLQDALQWRRYTSQQVRERLRALVDDFGEAEMERSRQADERGALVPRMHVLGEHFHLHERDTNAHTLTRVAREQPSDVLWPHASMIEHHFLSAYAEAIYNALE